MFGIHNTLKRQRQTGSQKHANDHWEISAQALTEQTNKQQLDPHPNSYKIIQYPASATTGINQIIHTLTLN